MWVVTYRLNGKVVNATFDTYLEAFDYMVEIVGLEPSLHLKGDWRPASVVQEEGRLRRRT
jgi:hypothetical protein